jgi:MarR family transcriptional regulator, organic hydroperoxide resistance regulator
VKDSFSFFATDRRANTDVVVAWDVELIAKRINQKSSPANPANEHHMNDKLSDTDPLKLDNQLCFALYAASRAITRTYRDRLVELGLTYPQYLVLTVLWESDALSLTAIGRHLRLDSGTLTPLVKRLETSGFVTRNRRSTDEREVEIALTAAGLALRTSAVAVRQHVVDRLGMTESEISVLRSELMSLVKTLDDDGEAEPAGDGHLSVARR